MHLLVKKLIWRFGDAVAVTERAAYRVERWCSDMRFRIAKLTTESTPPPPAASDAPLPRSRISRFHDEIGSQPPINDGDWAREIAAYKKLFGDDHFS